MDGGGHPFGAVEGFRAINPLKHRHNSTGALSDVTSGFLRSQTALRARQAFQSGSSPGNWAVHDAKRGRFARMPIRFFMSLYEWFA